MAKNKAEQLSVPQEQTTISEEKIDAMALTFFVIFAQEEKIDDRIAKKMAEHIKMLITTTVTHPSNTAKEILKLAGASKSFLRTFSTERNNQIISTAKAEMASHT